MYFASGSAIFESLPLQNLNVTENMVAKKESILAEAAAASVGGAISASVLYPLEVLKTKMQAVQTSDTKDINSDNGKDDEETQEGTEEGKIHDSELSAVDFTLNMYKEGGVGVFYEGIGTSAFQSACEKALYFFAYTFFKNSYKSVKGNEYIGTAENLILGAMAEWAHLPITLPIDCLTTKIQTSKSLDENPYQIMMAMFSEKGLKGMYKGWEAYTVLCLKPAIQYTVYEQIKRIVLLSRRKSTGRGRKKSSQTLSVGESFLLGLISRAISTIICFPYTRAKVMLQSQKDASVTGGQSKTIPQMLMKMYNEQGMQSLFIGLGPELTRGVLSTAFMMMIKEQIASIMVAMLT